MGHPFLPEGTFLSLPYLGYVETVRVSRFSPVLAAPNQLLIKQELGVHHMNSELSPLVQLQAFADWEAKHNPPPEGEKHIAQWAVEEIERLMEQNAILQEKLEDLCFPF